jgi:N-acetyl-anhydromuramyl-L-alanine amidase AmpD
VKPLLSPTEPFKKAPIGLVVHTTGGALVDRAHALGITPTERALKLYRELMREGPHWLIDQDGSTFNIQPAELVAYHVGTLNYKKRAAPVVQREYAWWRAAFPGLTSVGQHPLWRTGSVNAVAWGVEVIPPSDDPSAPWSDAAVDALADLIEKLPIAKARGATIVTHSEVSPYTRTAGGRPWDLPTAQAEQLDEIVRHLSRNT